MEVRWYNFKFVLFDQKTLRFVLVSEVEYFYKQVQGNLTLKRRNVNFLIMNAKNEFIFKKFKSKNIIY